MKQLLSVLVLTSLLAVATETTDGRPTLTVGANFGIFYSGLSPHGEWISLDGGAYGWRPLHVEVGWRPYWAGRWIWTDDGWYWDSLEPWAWATYHYGRWYYDDYYGWIWIPGYEWAPAWVEWRYGGDYVGWAPLGPYAVFHMGFGIHYSRYWVTPYHYWSFVDCGHLGVHNIHHYVYRTDDNPQYISRTRTAGNIRVEAGRVITSGPERSYVERRGNVRIERAEISDVGSRDQARVLRNGERERIDVYRPRIDEAQSSDTRERPSEVRERERIPSLDMQGTDLQRRTESHEPGRSIGRTGRTYQERLLDARSRARNERMSDPASGGQPDERSSVRRIEARTREYMRPNNDIRQERSRAREFNAERMLPLQRPTNRSAESEGYERPERSITREPSNNRPNNRSVPPPPATPPRSGGERRER